jgi:hypothetical protein
MLGFLVPSSTTSDCKTTAGLALGQRKDDENPPLWWVLAFLGEDPRALSLA